MPSFVSLRVPGVSATLLVAGLALAVDYLRWQRGRRRVAQTFAETNTSFGAVSYLDLGPRDGEVVLFVPGGGTGIDLVYAMPWLLRAGYRVIAIHRPGYHGVPLGDGLGFEDHAALYAEVLGQLSVGPVHVFALSAGGPSALFFAARHPTRSLTLWSAVTGSYGPNLAATQSWLGRVILSGYGQGLSSWGLARAARWCPRLLVASFLRTESHLTEPQIAALATHVLATPEGQVEFRAFVDSTTPMSRLYPGMMAELANMGRPWVAPWGDIRVPVLAAGSPVDKDVPPEHLARIRAELPTARIIEVTGGGHFVWWGADGTRVITETLRHLAAATP